MAGRPGVQFIRQAQRVVPGISTDVGTAFIVGLASTGSTSAYTLVESIDEYETAYDTSGTLHDAVETFFGEGGAKAYVARVAATDLDADWQAALDLFSGELGPGQVLAPGEDSTARHAQMLAHAASTNRVALLDGASGSDQTTLSALAAATAAVNFAEFGALFGTWLTIPQAVAGVDRTIAPTPAVAGLIARLGNQPNVWPIGKRGFLNYATGAVTEFTDAERSTLTDDGVNVILDDPNGLRLYGFRSVSTDDLYADFGVQRLIMRVEAEAKRIAEGFVGERITNGTIGNFGAALEGFMQSLYADGALFGDSPADAYRVAVESPVNTDATAAAGEMNAEIYLRGANHAELVRVTTVSVPVAGNVG